MSSAVEPIRSPEAIDLDDVEDSYQLSPMQQGMLFHTLSSPNSGVDIEQMFFTVQAALDPEPFRSAWEQVIERHTILRTSFQWEGLDQPLQHVHRRGRFNLEEADWRLFSKNEQKERLAAYLQRDRQLGFDLTRKSPMRVALFRIGEGEYHLIWTVHHALLDGRSLVNVLNEVYVTYDSIVRGEDPASQYRGFSGRPYRDYIDHISRIDTIGAEAFWREMLNGAARSALRPDRSAERTDIHQHEHRERELSLEAGPASSLGSLASECGVTIYTLVQAAWGLLLSRYSGERDVVFGATRKCGSPALQPGESALGLFINTLPVSVSVPDDTPVRCWLKEIRSRHLALRRYEHTPLQLIQRWCGVRAGKSLFESILVFEKYDLRAHLQSRWRDWKIVDFKFLEQTNYPLAVSCWSGDELLMKLEYDPRVFDEATVGRMLGHLKTVLEGMLTHAERPVSTLPMLTDAEKRQILVEWNDTDTIRPSNECVHQLFEARAATTPDAIAVIDRDRQLTYRELNERANQLAHHLRSAGVTGDTFVGVSLERSLEMIVGLLAILKAGGAYVPLDPAYPKERLAAMIHDSGVGMLLSQRRLLDQLPKTDAAIFYVDSD